MAYSQRILDYLSANNISIGDRVRLEVNGHVYEGLLLENPNSPDVLALKLDNGYNVGLKFNETLKLVSKSASSKPSNTPSAPNSNASVQVLMYGGTIASKVEYKTGAVHPSLTPEEFEEMFPDLNRWGPVGFKNVRNILSEDMSPAHWRLLSEEVYYSLKEDKSVVVTHGTDTMSYSSAALSFALQGLTKPVVLTGAQRSSDRGSSDNLENFMNALFFASKGIPGVYVVMHKTSNDGLGSVHLGTRVRKMHTSRRDAFKSINVPPIADIDYRRELLKYHWQPKFNSTNPSDNSSNSNLRLINTFNENVGLIYIYPGIQPKFIEKLRDFDGIVLAGTGLGHVSTNPFNDDLSLPIINEIKQLIESDIPVVMAPQTIHGRINLEVYTAGRLLKSIGVIGHLCDWTPETAYVKLSWVLGQTKNPAKVRELMLTPIAGECSDRTIYTPSF